MLQLYGNQIGIFVWIMIIFENYKIQYDDIYLNIKL